MVLEMRKYMLLTLIAVVFLMGASLRCASQDVEHTTIKEKSSMLRKVADSLLQASTEVSSNVGQCISDVKQSMQFLGDNISAKCVSFSKVVSNAFKQNDKILEPSVTLFDNSLEIAKLHDNSELQNQDLVTTFSVYQSDVPSEGLEPRVVEAKSSKNEDLLNASDDMVDLTQRIDDVYAFIDQKMSSTIDVISDKIATAFTSLDKKIKDLQVTSDLNERIVQLDGGMKKMFKAVNERINSLKHSESNNKLSVHVKKLDDELRQAILSLNKRLDTVDIKKVENGTEVWEEVQSLNSYIEKVYVTLNNKIAGVKTETDAQIGKAVNASEINGLNSKIETMSTVLSAKMKVLKSDLERFSQEESQAYFQSIENVSKNFEKNIDEMKNKVELLVQQVSNNTQEDKKIINNLQNVNTRVAELSKDLSEVARNPQVKKAINGLNQKIATLDKRVGEMKEEVLAQAHDQHTKIWNEIDDLNNQFKVAHATIDEKIDTKMKYVDTDVNIRLSRMSDEFNTAQSKLNREIISLKDDSDRLKNATLPHLEDLKKTAQQIPLVDNVEQLAVNKQAYDEKIKEEVKKQLSTMREDTLKVKHVRKKQRLQKILDLVLEKEDE